MFQRITKDYSRNPLCFTRILKKTLRKPAHSSKGDLLNKGCILEQNC